MPKHYSQLRLPRSGIGAHPHELAAYRGVLTPHELDAPERETAALLHGAAVHDLGWMRRVAVRGEDRFRWLSGMVTNTVNDLFPNSGAWNLVLNAQGRIQGDLTVWRGAKSSLRCAASPEAASQERRPAAGHTLRRRIELELEIAADQYEKLMAHLNHFIIMDDVELVPLGDEHWASRLGDRHWADRSLADEVLARLGLPALAAAHDRHATLSGTAGHARPARLRRAGAALRALGSRSQALRKFWRTLRTAGATPVGCAALEEFRIAEGIPAYGVDIAERDLPQETSQMRALTSTRAVTWARRLWSASVRAAMFTGICVRLELAGPVPAAGTELTLDDGDSLPVRSPARPRCRSRGRRVFALGMIRAEAEIARQTFTYNAGAATGTATFWPPPPDSFANQRLQIALQNSIGLETGTMSETPKFKVIDRRKIKAEEEQENHAARARAAPETALRQPSRSGGPRLVVNEAKPQTRACRPGRGSRNASCLPRPPPRRAANRRRPTMPRRNGLKIWSVRRILPLVRSRLSPSSIWCSSFTSPR